MFDQSLQSVHKQLVDRKLSVQELTALSLQRIAEVDEQIGAFLHVDEAGAKAMAAQLDEKLAQGSERGALFGLPAAIKDNIVTQGLPTTCASQFLKNYDPVYDATVIKKLKQADTVIVGKTNMDEFAMGSSTETSAFKKTRNPWNQEHVPGGSSGGSAASVAAGEVYFALGSDTGGSIRQPAAYCGVVGLKPTYGRVSRYGCVAFASSFDQIGPITKNVEDAAYVLQAIAGVDPDDPTSAPEAVPDYLAALSGDVKGLRIGVPKEYLGEGIAPEVKSAIMTALNVLEKLGASWEEVTLPHTQHALATYYILSSAEASSNLARFDGIRYGKQAKADNLLDLYINSRTEGFGEEVKRRIMLGTYTLSSGYYDAYYLKAQKVRTLIQQDFNQLWDQYDVLVGPTTPTPAFRLGEKMADPLTMYANDICTIPVNLAGVPAISVPAGLVDGLPIGLQVIGKPFAEATILRVAHAFEQATDHHTNRPAL